MSITAKWFDEEKTIIFCEVDAAWTWNDAYTAVEQACRMIASVDHHTVIIIQVVSPIPSRNAVFHAQRLAALLPANVSKVIIVGNLYAKSIVSAASSFNKRVAEVATYAHSVAEAHRLLDEMPPKPAPSALVS